MSWNFKQAGVNKATLKAAIQAEDCPADVRDRLCARVDALEPAKLPSGEESQIILVESTGHHPSASAQVFFEEMTERSRVVLVEFRGTLPKAPGVDAAPSSEAASGAS